jgi:hypothetical protein
MRKGTDLSVPKQGAESDKAFIRQLTDEDYGLSGLPAVREHRKGAPPAIA